MRRGQMGLAVATIWAVSTLQARATYFVVDTTADGADALPGDGVCEAVGGGCSLRAAIEEANALAGADAVIVPAGTYSVSPLQVSDSLVLGGAGAESTVVAGSLGTVITANDADLALLDLTVAGGHGNNVGGGVSNNGGHLAIINSVVRDNFAMNTGGGVYNNSGTLTVIGSTVSNNFAFNVGGGIHNEGTAMLMNSTISGNRVVNTSGGIGNEGSLQLTNCTVTGNGAANAGAGIDNDFDDAQQLVLENTILADNRALQFNPLTGALLDLGPGADCTGSKVSGSYNLIQSSFCTIDGVGNLTGVSAQLGGLQDNGGPTPTHALRGSSPAIDAGSPATPGSSSGACPETDQRGITRPYGTACDIGAYEAAACGNGVLDAGETCDDGNGIDGDGCDSNCTLTGCGNGITTAGEECDDGNLRDGDCCSSTCALTIDDGLVLAETAGSSVQLREGGDGSLKWKWRGAAPTTMDAFGDPTTSTSYTLCVVDESGATPSLIMTAEARAGGTCGGRPCWGRGGSGFTYKGNVDGPGRLGKLKLKAGPAGAAILVKGKGSRLRLGQLPLRPPVRVVLRKSEGSGTFGASFGGMQRNQVDQYKATSD